MFVECVWRRLQCNCAIATAIGTGTHTHRVPLRLCMGRRLCVLQHACDEPYRHALMPPPPPPPPLHLFPFAFPCRFVSFRFASRLGDTLGGGRGGGTITTQHLGALHTLAQTRTGAPCLSLCGRPRVCVYCNFLCAKLASRPSPLQQQRRLLRACQCSVKFANIT